MRDLLTNYRIFWKEFRHNFKTTGAVMPSGRLLARSLCRYVREGERPRRILEVGPGTGAVTARLVKLLGPADRLDLVELNEQFVRRLQERFASEPGFRAVAPRCRVLHQRMEELPDGEQYDLIISGLPLNNFAAEDVAQIFAVFRRLIAPGGTLSFFEYIAIRQCRALVSGADERARLSGITRVLNEALIPHEIRRDWIWPNVPPAWVHHLRWPDTNHTQPARTHDRHRV